MPSSLHHRFVKHHPPSPSRQHHQRHRRYHRKRPPRRPKWPPRGFPRGPEEAKIIDFQLFLKVFRDFALSGQERPKTAQEAPKIVPRRPKRPPEGPENGPRGPQDGLRGSQQGPKMAPQEPQDSPGRPHESPLRNRDERSHVTAFWTALKASPHRSLRWHNGGTSRRQPDIKPYRLGACRERLIADSLAPLACKGRGHLVCWRSHG